MIVDSKCDNVTAKLLCYKTFLSYNAIYKSKDTLQAWNNPHSMVFADVISNICGQKCRSAKNSRILIIETRARLLSQITFVFDYDTDKANDHTNEHKNISTKLQQDGDDQQMGKCLSTLTALLSTRN